jgi:hypothetical protein
VPFLRVIRDKRGYETTYLMHWYRDGNRQRSKVLYVFRTPDGVRVGRHPLDPDILREIEAQHPDIDFDWDVVRDNQQVIEPSPEMRRRRPRREGAESPAPPAPAPAQPAAATPRPSIPATIEGATPDEKVAFLLSLYPVVRERIAQRTSDPVRLETLQALAERLNPTVWTDADQITAGLQQAAEALERLSHVLSKRRRRSRKSRAHRERAVSGEAPAGAAMDTDQATTEATDDLDDTSAADDAAESPDTEHQ